MILAARFGWLALFWRLALSALAGCSYPLYLLNACQ
jgi:hypothetical protein